MVTTCFYKMIWVLIWRCQVCWGLLLNQEGDSIYCTDLWFSMSFLCSDLFVQETVYWCIWCYVCIHQYLFWRNFEILVVVGNYEILVVHVVSCYCLLPLKGLLKSLCLEGVLKSLLCSILSVLFCWTCTFKICVSFTWPYTSIPYLIFE